MISEKQLAQRKKYGFQGGNMCQEKHRSEQTKRKISETRLKRKERLGYLNSLETRDKISKALRGSPNNRDWKGGISIGKNRKEYLRFKCNERMARKKNAEGLHSLVEWREVKKRYNWTCPACGRSEPEIQLTQDHIIPLSKGGSNYIENIQPLCRSCNSKKNTRVIYYPRSKRD